MHDAVYAVHLGTIEPSHDPCPQTDGQTHRQTKPVMWPIK